MVKLCDSTYPTEENKYNHIFKTFPFEPDHFQKYGIHGLEEGKHILITAHTGSGKTLTAEYAIQKFASEGKKVIYTSPIKSLSNQKYYEFTEKFPEISFGIMTGDIKFNPEADCLIMTTEILRNTLFQKEMIEQMKQNGEKTENANSNGFIMKLNDTLTFDIDIYNDLACAIFDEVHYINDRDRGKVWEETIIKMPNHIQMVLLSATIDRSQEFAQWIEDIKEREVWIASTSLRVVPLTHYNYFVINKPIIKACKDKPLKDLMEQIHNQVIPIKSTISSEFHTQQLLDYNKILSYFYKNRIHIDKKFALNSIVNKVHSQNMLPAICFVFSRKNVEYYASIIERSLFNDEDQDDRKLKSVVEKECRKILMKLPNYKEYIEMPEYQFMMKLLEKGIAIHHSGVMPILREMIELLFSKGYIKLLFATETFSVGINMPTKTVLFTSLQKFDGSSQRFLHSHEYTQMAGRAGRRGLDDVGHVIHINNMFDLPDTIQYKTILGGKPQTLISKFQLHPNLVLKILHHLETQQQSDKNIIYKICDFAHKSLNNLSIIKNINQTRNECLALQNEINEFEAKIQSYEKMDMDQFYEYKELKFKEQYSKPKQRKRIQKQLDEMCESIGINDKLYESFQYYLGNREKYVALNEDLEYYKTHYESKILDIIDFLNYKQFIMATNISIDNNEQPQIKMTELGIMASQIQEVHGMSFAEIMNEQILNNFSPIELTCLLSCFTNVKVKDEFKQPWEQGVVGDEIVELYDTIYYKLEGYHDEELKRQNYSFNPDDYTMIYDLIIPVRNWCNAQNERECKMIIQELNEIGIFSGEFVKALLKINNIANELTRVCVLTNNVKLQHTLSQIEEMTLKYVATNQSLYI